MIPRCLFLSLFIFFLTLSHSQAAVTNSSFAAALDTLQSQIGYKFQSVDLLRRSMTHPSFSGENYRTLSLLGLDAVRSAASLRLLQKDVDVSPKEMDHRLEAVAGVSPCSATGLRIGLQKVVRVSPRTDPSADSVVCGAYRAVFGAVAVDSGSVDVAGEVFWRVHGQGSAVLLDDIGVLAVNPPNVYLKSG